MNGKNIGYIRVSSVNQHTDRQLADMIERGELDKVFTDKASGKNTDRPAFQEMMRFVREGDCIWVHSQCRLSRSISDLSKTVNELLARNISIVFVKEGLRFEAGKKDAVQTLLLHMLSSFSEFELTLIHERQAEGIAKARLRNAYANVGRKPLKPEIVEEMRQRVAAGQRKTDICREMKISRTCLYSYLKGDKADTKVA